VGDGALVSKAIHQYEIEYFDSRSAIGSVGRVDRPFQSREIVQGEIRHKSDTALAMQSPFHHHAVAILIGEVLIAARLAVPFSNMSTLQFRRKTNANDLPSSPTGGAVSLSRQRVRCFIK
jgi:hypothetical protein